MQILAQLPAESEPTISMTALLELLKNADPEVKAQLRLALLTCKIYHAFHSNSRDRKSVA